MTEAAIMEGCSSDQGECQSVVLEQMMEQNTQQIFIFNFDS